MPIPGTGHPLFISANKKPCLNKKTWLKNNCGIYLGNTTGIIVIITIRLFRIRDSR